MSFIMSRTGVAFLALLASVSATVAERPAADLDLSGRWTAKGRFAVTMDITRCGTRWCGVMVEATGTCGFRALDLGFDGPTKGDMPGPHHVSYRGEFRRSEGGERYIVHGVARPEQTGLPNEITISGRQENTPPYTRMMPLHLQLSRAGDAHCKSERPVS